MYFNGRMLRRRPPAELGKLIDTHRPLHPVLGWGLIVLVALVLTPFATGGEIASLPVYAVIFVALCYLEALVLGPQFLLEHRLYEHGLVLRTMLIGTPVYVIPHCTVRVDRLRSVPGRPETGMDTTPHRRKCAGTRPSVRLYGLVPERARLLGKGKGSWDEAAGSGPTPARREWEIDYRDAERHVDRLRETVLASQREHPYVGRWG